MSKSVEQYLQGLSSVVQQGAAHQLNMATLCDGLVLQIARMVASAKISMPDMDMDGMLEIVRHRLDMKTIAFLTNGSAAPTPPKELS